ncbi:universal stress protein [Chiayiivirga flava]|uniref:Nucleotide-binding universal stress UspA family protein n=1 Tax=Chiayiivirga flava TaxID=659595 RepID=A0A7W8D283_9GAMM|nr:universal stress protein [Chiayiivirga flava]MBB5206539.1 nucleotide-binding universal stress UspA family protein [Chiayiivirga flava]
MYRSIVVALSGQPSDDDAARVAMDLAERHRARVTLLQVMAVPVPDATAWGFASAASLKELYAAMAAAAAQSAERLRARVARDGVPLAVRTLEAWSGDAGGTAADSARTADLVVTGARGAEAADRLVTTLLFECGRPVLIVPPACRALAPPGRAVVAWTPTREAARAVHDALPLLADAASVDVVTIRSDPAADRNGGTQQVTQSLRLLVDHLRRHGVSARAQSAPEGGRTAAAELLDRARTLHADLLVAGAYGHARMREWWLGGTTRDLLRDAALPLLLAH